VAELPDNNPLSASAKPLDMVPAETQIRAGHLAGFHALVQRYGGDPHQLLLRYGISPLHLADPDQYIDYAAMARLLEGCRTAFADPLFGLRLAMLQGPDVFGCVTALARAAATVREGLAALVEFLPATHSHQGELALVERGGVAELCWLASSEFATMEQVNCQFLLLQIKVLQMLIRPDFRPDYALVKIAPSQPTRLELAKTVGCRLEFGQRENVIGFPAALLDRPVTSANKLTYRLLRDHLKAMMEAADADVAARVQSYIRGALPTGNCAIARCARRLGTTVRSLQIQLEKAGASFSDLLERERIEIAKGELYRGNCSVQEIAGMLGYSEQASFGRAFKRWTGLSPRAFRETRLVPRCRDAANWYRTIGAGGAR